jgi:sugar transferase EpsL
MDSPLFDRTKRIIDIVLAGLGLLVLAPIMLATAVAVSWKLGCPVLFKQRRPGLNGKIFICFKFRTMSDARDARGALLPDNIRLSHFGKILRATSLDELPQLLNILWGDMSLVGPRPLLPSYLELYSPRQARRHEVKPGLTGFAQINGRNSVDWDRRFRMDVWYVDNRSLRLDVEILLRSVRIVLGRRGVSASDKITMATFQGDQQERPSARTYVKPPAEA